MDHFLRLVSLLVPFFFPSASPLLYLRCAMFRMKHQRQQELTQGGS